MRFTLAGLVILLMALWASAAEEKLPALRNPDEGKINDQVAKEIKQGMPKGREPLQYPKGDGLRALIVGNSWTWPVKKPLPEIAKAAGIKDQHIIVTGFGSYGGHANNFFKKPEAKKVFAAIETGQWDVLTLILRAGYKDKPEHFTQWIDLGLKANPDMTFLIQEGWPRPSKLAGGPAGIKAEMADAKAVVANMEAALAKEQAEFKVIHDELAKKYPGKVRMIPCGAAVVEMVRLYSENKLPGYDCIMEWDYTGDVDKNTVNKHGLGAKGLFGDNGHLSEAGRMSQLLSYIFYAALYRKSPEIIKDYAPAGIDASVDQLMRKTAWKAITGYPPSGITDKDGDGVADEAKPQTTK